MIIQNAKKGVVWAKHSTFFKQLKAAFQLPIFTLTLCAHNSSKYIVLIYQIESLKNLVPCSKY